MSDPTEWIRGLVPEEQVNQLQELARRIERQAKSKPDPEAIYEMSLVMSEDDMVYAIKNFKKMQDGDTEAWMYGISMLVAIIETIKYALEEYVEGDPDEDANP